MLETKNDIKNNILNRQNHHSSSDKCLLSQLHWSKTTAIFTSKTAALAGTLASDINDTQGIHN